MDIWCNSVSNYYQHVPEPDIETTTEVSNLQVKPSIVKGYGSKRPDSVEEPVKVKRERMTSPVETDNIQSLLTQAEKLVNKAKSIVTTTKSEKLSTKGRTKGRTSTTTEFPVETNSDPLDVASSEDDEQVSSNRELYQRYQHGFVLFIVKCVRILSQP